MLGRALPRAGQLLLLWPPSPGKCVPTAPQPTSHRKSSCGPGRSHSLCSPAIFRDPPCCGRLSIVHSGEVFSQEPSLQGPRVSREFRGDGSEPGRQLFPCVRSLAAQRGGPEFCHRPPRAFDTDLIREGVRRGRPGRGLSSSVYPPDSGEQETGIQSRYQRPRGSQHQESSKAQTGPPACPPGQPGRKEAVDGISGAGLLGEQPSQSRHSHPFSSRLLAST